MDDAADHSGEEDGFDEEQEEENFNDRHFINDDASSIASSRNGYRAPSDSAFPRRGRPVEYNAEDIGESKAKRARTLPRELQPLQPLGLYCDYPMILPFASLLPRISHLVSPYAWYHHCEPASAAQCGVILGPNEFVRASHVSWIQHQENQLRFARLFGSYGTYNHTAGSEPLRPVARMQEVGTADSMHTCSISPVAEVICAHNVLNERDELDTQPCPDVSDEFVCKGDFVTERKLRGCSMGGLPGLPSVVLFAFEESTSSLQVSESVLRIFKYWNLAMSRPELLAGNLHAVQTEMTEFYKNPRTNSKSARVKVKPILRATELDDRATLEHVHPDLLNKLASPAVHVCRTPTRLDSTDVSERVVNRVFECQIHVVPNRVRDSRGKVRYIVASILRIQSTIPGCDPLLALRGLTQLQGFSQELLNITQHMVRMLHVPRDISIDKLFDSSPSVDLSNLASIGHEANLPLAFFNFLRLKEISSPQPSPFAADWMGQRIDVYDSDEVAFFWDFLKVVHHSRMVYYSHAVIHTSQDLRDSRNAQRELLTTSVDWKLFFPGQHYRAVPKSELQADFASSPATDEQRQAFDDWIENNPDPTYVFLPCDGSPHTRGYVLVTQPTMRPEDNPEKVKLREQQAYKEGEIREDELQCIHYCSRRYGMMSTFALSNRDAYAVFLHPETPYPSVENLRNNISRLSTIEREYFTLLTTPLDQGVLMQRERMRTNLAISLFGHSGHPLHGELKTLNQCSDATMLLTHTHDVIANHVLKQLHVAANAPAPQLKNGARFIIDLVNVDENPPKNEAGQSIATQHMDVHTSVNTGVINDDAQAARREARQFCAFQSELNVVNHAVLRWLLLAHLSVWSSTLDGCYGYCIQICDMGNSVQVCLKKSGKFNEDELTDWDKKMPGSGADMVWNIFGEYVNGFPKFLARTSGMREFASGHNFCELYQQKSLMSFKRLNGLVKNVKDCVLESMSEHNDNLGVVGAMNELNKLEQDMNKINAIWPTIEAGLGQSGATSQGVNEKPFTTTLSGVVVNITVLNPLQLICLASNQLSVSRPISVNAGSRVVPVTSGCGDELGRIVDQIAAGPSAPQERRQPVSYDHYTEDISDSRDPRKVDDAVVRRNMSMFLMEYLARVFALMHRGMCLKRHVRSGFGMIVWSNTKNCCKQLTSNLRKPTYSADDIMDRNLSGSLETLVYGKWARSVLQMALHRRLTRTVRTGPENEQTQLQHVLPDAIKTLMLVSVTPAVLLSAMQLYLTLAILNPGVMLVSCMVLYYLQLPKNCSLDILALVVSGNEGELTTHERQRYYDFAAFLHQKLFGSLVSTNRLVRNIQPANVTSALANNADQGLVSECCHQAPASFYICDTFFKIQPQRPRPDASAVDPELAVASAFSATQENNSAADSRAQLFWAHAGPGTRIPMPHNKSNDRNHRQFAALNVCPHFYKEIRKKLHSSRERSSNFGVLINFLRMCKAPAKLSRYDLVCRLLQPWADETDTSLEAMHDALAANNDWKRPILDENQTIEASMLEWAVNLDFNNHQMQTKLGLAVDVLWLILSQALFADEWVCSPIERVAVVHTRNMSNAAQTLVCLYLHTSIPKAAVPACHDGGVILSEPSQILSKAGEAIAIPYRARLHVDSGADGAAFVNMAMRDPCNMRLIRTRTHGPFLISKRIQLLDRETNEIGVDAIETCEICPFPPESVAHMLPAIPSLMAAFRRMHVQHPDLCTWPESQWALATRLFGSAGDIETLAYMPVALTQHALDEEVPCFTYKHGFCFVLAIDGPLITLTPVNINTMLKPRFEDATLLAHSTFTPLPLARPDDVLSFPCDQLSHAMSGGLVLQNGFASYRPPAFFCDGPVPDDVTPIAFSFMPILRFQALLMIELNAPGADASIDWRPYQETTDTDLTVAVLNTHQDSDVFLLNGHYSIRFHDLRYNHISEIAVDYVSASQCMLADGRRVYYTFTPQQFEELVKEVGAENGRCPNRNVAVNIRFKPENINTQNNTFTLECYYTLSHQPREADLRNTRVRIAFKLLKVAWLRDQHTIVYAEVPLYNSDSSARLHLLDPAQYPVATHFVSYSA